MWNALFVDQEKKNEMKYHHNNQKKYINPKMERLHNDASNKRIH